MASLGTFPPSRGVRRLQLRRGRVGRGRTARRAAPGRERHRRLLSGVRADDGRLGGDRSTPSSPTTYSIKYVAHYSDSVQPLFYKITSYWGGLDGSIMFWVFLLSVFGSIAVYVNRERHRELIPYVVATISTVQMFFLYLMVVHKNPFTTFLPDGARRRRGAESAAAELLHGDSSAIALHGIRRDDDPVRVRHRGARHRPPRRLVAARRPPLDDVRLAVSVVRPHPRHDLGVRRARVGRLLGVGSGRERGAPAVVHRHGVSAFGDGAGAAQHAARVERRPRHRDVLPDDLRHVPDAVGHRRSRCTRSARIRCWRGCSPASWSSSSSSASAW